MKDLPQIRGFRVFAELGSGAMGRVFAAELTGSFNGLETGHRAALKVIRPELLDDQNSRARFDREMKIGVAVADDHLMRMYGEGRTEEGLPFVAMELLEGDPLDSMLRRTKGALEVEPAVGIALGIAKGLKALHDHGIIHRDLKPPNVMILTENGVKLMDYGLARMLEVSTMLTRTGSFLGTFHYSSPEQFGGRTGVPSDLWSLGVIMYEMLTGRLPFDYDTIPEVVSAIQLQTPLPAETANPLIPPNVCGVLSRLLEKNIHRRLASADEVISALEEKPGPALEEFLAASHDSKNENRRKMEGVLPFAPDFQGRESEKKSILEKMFDPRVAAVAITGIKGLGKSALIAEVAKEAREEFEGEGLYYDVRKDGLTWGTLTERVFRELEYDANGQRIEDALIRALSKCPSLLVIDSAEALKDEDWGDIAKFLSLVEHRRAEGGFGGFPSAVLIGARAVPVLEHELDLEEEALSGLAADEGAGLLVKLTRDTCPSQWKDTGEREWISERVGGHPEMLRLIAKQVGRKDYRRIRKAIASMSGRLMERIEEVIGWSVERLGEEGRKLIPYFACFDKLSFEDGELAAAANLDPDSLEVEEGLEQLQFSAGLIHWDHVTHTNCFHASLYEWAERRLTEEELHAAHGLIAEHWESRFDEMPRDPQGLDDLKPILSAIKHSVAAREIGAALNHISRFVFPTSQRGAKGEELFRILQRHGMFGEWLSMAQLLSDAVDREESDREWAHAMIILGLACWASPTGDRQANMQNAVRCYQLALEVITRDAAPIDWAKTMMWLGNARIYLPTGDSAQNLREAIRCYEAALEVFTRESAPFDWAGIMNNLGHALSEPHSGDRTENLSKSIRCYKLALEVFTREAAPGEWARTMMNLGSSLRELPASDRAENLREAIHCFELALEVRTRESGPFYWAVCQYRFGLTWLAYGEQQSDSELEKDCLSKAVGCFENALEVWTEEAYPHDNPIVKAELDRARIWLETGLDPGETSVG